MTSYDPFSPEAFDDTNPRTYLPNSVRLKKPLPHDATDSEIEHWWRAEALQKAEADESRRGQSRSKRSRELIAKWLLGRKGGNDGIPRA